MQEEVRSPRGVVDGLGLWALRYLDRIIKKPLTLGIARTLVGLNLLIVFLLIVLALNHLLALRWITDWDYVWHLFEFGLLISLLVLMLASWPGRPTSRSHLHTFAILFLTYSTLNLVQNLTSAFGNIQEPALFLVLTVIATPLNLILGTLAFSPTLFVWMRSLLGQPSTQ